MGIELLLDIASSTAPDRVVLGSREDGLSLDRLAALAAGGALVIRDSGARTLVFLGSNGAAFPVAVFASARAGVPICPLNYRLSNEQLTGLLDRVEDPLIVADEEQVAQVAGRERVLTSAQWLEQADAASRETERIETELLIPAEDESAAVLLFTSGTTSTPKCVVLRHEHLLAYVLQTVDPASAAEKIMYLMADGLTRLMAPILSFTADELWRFLPGAREESVHMARVPDAAPSSTRCVDRDLLERWTAPDRRCASRCSPRSSRCGRTSRSAARCRRRWSCRRRRPSCALLERVRARAADALHRVGGRAAAGAADVGRRSEPRVTIERAGGVKCERCWRYVPAVSTRSGVGRAVRPLPGRAGRDRPWLTPTIAPARCRRRRAALEIWLPIAHRRARSADEGDGPRDGCRCTPASTVVPGLLDFTHVRNTGAAFGILNAADFPFKTRGHRGRSRRRRSSASACTRPASRTISWSRASAWRSSSAAPPAT